MEQPEVTDIRAEPTNKQVRAARRAYLSTPNTPNGASMRAALKAALLAERPAPTPEDRERLVDLIDDAWTSGLDAYGAADALIAAGVTFR